MGIEGLASNGANTDHVDGADLKSGHTTHTTGKQTQTSKERLSKREWTGDHLPDVTYGQPRPGELTSNNILLDLLTTSAQSSVQPQQCNAKRRHQSRRIITKGVAVHRQRLTHDCIEGEREKPSSFAALTCDSPKYCKRVRQAHKSPCGLG